MTNFTQKWAIVSFIEPVEDGLEFHSSQFPLHITLAGVFKTELSSNEMYNQLSKIVQNQKPLKVYADKEAMFGPNNDIRVMKVNPSSDLIALYNKIHKWLISLGSVYNSPEYQGDNYSPHITYKDKTKFKQNQGVEINSLSIIDLYPKNDGHNRKITHTISLQ